MDELSVSGGSTWVCSQRPDCRGRRNARKQHKPISATTPTAVVTTKAKPLATAPQSVEQPQAISRGGRARTIVAAMA